MIHKLKMLHRIIQLLSKRLNHKHNLNTNDFIWSHGGGWKYEINVCKLVTKKFLQQNDDFIIIYGLLCNL